MSGHNDKNNAHLADVMERIEKERYDNELREREVKALEEIACISEFLGYLTEEVKNLRIAIEINEEKK